MHPQNDDITNIFLLWKLSIIGSINSIQWLIFGSAKTFSLNSKLGGGEACIKSHL